jgi:nicotinate-nucleotide adenylyltransferase
MSFPSPPSPYLFAHQTVGLLGGAFNPAHAGHVFVSEQVKKALGLDHVWWLVAADHPTKAAGELAPLKTRYNQAKQQATSHPFIHVTAVEASLHTSYSVDTIHKLKQRYPTTRFVWIIGADNWCSFHLWHRWTQLLALVPVIVYDRGPLRYKALAGKAAFTYKKQRIPVGKLRFLPYYIPPAWGLLMGKKHAASSSAIRQRHTANFLK